MKKSIASVQFIQNSTETKIICAGSWTLLGIADVAIQLEQISTNIKMRAVINGHAIEKMDSSGAWQLRKLISKLQEQRLPLQLEDFAPKYESLLSIVEIESKKITSIPKAKRLPWLARLGKRSVELFSEFRDFFVFIGETTITAIQTIKGGSKLRWRSLLSIIETMGFQALPIIALLSFMIGVVLTYQMGLQLRNYGANIFIVDLLGLAVFREFGPLLTAIMVAGRTGSAFTAQIGTMKLNEEVDALRTMGITPAELLILPRIFGLMIVLPLLTVWADIFGVLGGMVMSNNMLNITWSDFLSRFQNVIPIKSLIIGMSKTPVFALLIASIGCFQGMQVVGSADSVGKKTTKSVVQAIFCIIVADAFFSIMFSKFHIW